MNIKMKHIYLLYDALREGNIKIDTISVSQRERHMAALDLVSAGFFKLSLSKGFHDKFTLTKYGKKYIQNYDRELRKGELKVPDHVGEIPEFMEL